MIYHFSIEFIDGNWVRTIRGEYDIASRVMKHGRRPEPAMLLIHPAVMGRPHVWGNVLATLKTI